VFSIFRRPPFIALLAVLLGAFLRFHRLGAVPPGLHYDFAANAILVNNIASGAFREVFITAYTGKEVLFFYSAGLLFKLIGSSIFALQLTAALYGVLGIAACYFAARELTRHDSHSAWIAALAAAIMSFTFMHLVWSRYGERATTEPFVQGLAIGFLFRGLRLSQGNDAKGAAINMMIAGAFTGLAAYTYLAARLFPIPIAVALAAFTIGQLRRPSNHPTIQPPNHPTTQPPSHPATHLALFTLAATLVFAPLGLFFLRHPEAFLIRANQLTPREGETDLLLKGVIGALGMIFVSGEPYDRFNIPGRPIFGPPLGFFFCAGLLITIARLFRAPHSTPHAPLFSLTYLLTFLTPTALSVHDIFPSNVRSMGLLPVLTLFPALGLVTVVQRLSPLLRRPPAFILHLSSFILLFLGVLTTYHSYFNLWAAAPSLHYANDTDLVNASRWLNAQNTSNTSVYLSAIHYRHPTVAYLARGFQSFRWLTGGESLAIPEGPTLYLFPHSAPPPDDWIAQWTPIAAPLGPDGSPDFRAYRFDSTPPLPNFIPASANFGNIIEITGYRLPAPGIADIRLRVLNPPDRPDYRLVADLADSAGHRWTQAFNDSYFSEQWQAGETILMRLKFSIEIGTPPGNYQLLLTVYSPSADATLPTLTANGYSAAHAAVGPIPIPRSDPQPLAQPVLAIGGVNVIRIDPPPARIRPGERLPFTLHWQPRSPIANPLILITRLGTLVVESSAPVQDTYPATQWLPGEIVIDHHQPRLPRDLASGEYTVAVNGVGIGAITVDPIQRIFDSPSPSHPLIANYQSLIELIGCDLAADSITLYWRALKETDTDYTTFVHVLDADGNIIAQHDSQPRGGSYPTSMWAQGEYIADTIRIPTAGRAIEIGWYVAETGERLTTTEGDAARIAP